MSGKRVRRRARRRRASRCSPRRCVAAAGLTWAAGLRSTAAREPEGGARDVVRPVARADAVSRPESPTTSASPPASAAPATPARRVGPVGGGARAGPPAERDDASPVRRGVDAAGRCARRARRRPHRRVVARRLAARRPLRRDADRGPHRLAAPRASVRTSSCCACERGDRIVVRSAHLVQRFRVSSLRLVPRSSLAGVTDIFSASGPRRLVDGHLRRPVRRRPAAGTRTWPS